MAWKCKHGYILAGLELNKCPEGCTLESGAITGNKPDWITQMTAAKELKMTPNEELYIKFYNEMRISVADMTDIELTEKIQKLEEIALSAKAKLNAARDTQREKRAKLTVKQQDWLRPVQRTQEASDAINAVQGRKDRMSRLEKQIDAWKKMGLDDDVIATMAKNIEKKQTEKGLNKAVSELKAVAKEISAVQPQAQPEPVKPTSPDPNDWFK